MEKVTAAEAKQKFGELLDKAQRGPVEITNMAAALVYWCLMNGLPLTNVKKTQRFSGAVRAFTATSP